MRLIAYAQNRIPPTRESILANIKAPLPKFSLGKPQQSQYPPYIRPTGSPYDVTMDALQKYEAYFEQIDQQKLGLMTGEQAKEVFTQSELDDDTLFAIWGQCDTGDKGCLDRAEFIVAVHLMALVRKGVPLQPQLPPTLRFFMTEYQKTVPPKQELIDRSEKFAQQEAAGEQPSYNQSPSKGYLEPQTQSPQKVQYQEPETKYESTRFDSYSKPTPTRSYEDFGDTAPKNQPTTYSTSNQAQYESKSPICHSPLIFICTSATKPTYTPSYDFGRSALEEETKPTSVKEDLSSKITNFFS